MKKFFVPILAVILAIGFSAFTSFQKSDSGANDLTNYNWYRVVYDQDHPDGFIPSNAQPEFTGIDQSTANSMDDCEDTGADCLRGFTGTPSLPNETRGNSQTERSAP